MISSIQGDVLHLALLKVYWQMELRIRTRKRIFWYFIYFTIFAENAKLPVTEKPQIIVNEHTVGSTKGEEVEKSPGASDSGKVVGIVVGLILVSAHRCNCGEYIVTLNSKFGSGNWEIFSH